MTTTPAPQYALQLLADGKTLRQAADGSGLEVGEVVAALVGDWKQRRATSAGTAPGTADRGWEPYLRHPSAKVVRAAERLRDTFEAEDRKAQLYAEKQRLEAQLRRVKAQISGGRTTAGTTLPQGEHPCPDCDKILTTPQGLGAHRSRAHGYRAAA